MTQFLKLQSPAKLNLFLHILGQRPDGMHNLQTVFQFIDFCDELTFSHREDDRIRLTPALIDVPDSQNLIIKAALLLREHMGCQQGVDIMLSKHLPLGAGLGGASSDAATTLVALNELWQLGLNRSELMTLGLQLGADVPIFIYGHSAWAEGVGEQFTQMILPEPWYVLVMPHCHVSTATMFADPGLTRDSAPLKIAHYQPGMGHNDFEPVARQHYPQVAQALDWLGQFGDAKMSGSGGTVFLGFDSLDEASRIAARVPQGLSTRVARGLNVSPLHQQLG